MVSRLFIYFYYVVSRRESRVGNSEGVRLLSRHRQIGRELQAVGDEEAVAPKEEKKTGKGSKPFIPIILELHYVKTNGENSLQALPEKSENNQVLRQPRGREKGQEGWVERGEGKERVQRELCWKINLIWLHFMNVSILVSLRTFQPTLKYKCWINAYNFAEIITPLKLVDKFTYVGSSVESTEKDIDTRLTKAWTAINRLSMIWKSDLTDKMKRSFFQAAVTSILLYGCTTWTLTKRLEKKLDGNYTRMLRAILNKSWRQHPTRHQLYGHLPSCHENYSS